MEDNQEEKKKNLKKKLPGKVGALYKIRRDMRIEYLGDSVLIPSESIVMLLEKRINRGGGGLGSYGTDYKVLSADGCVGWIVSCVDTFFHMDFKIVGNPS